MNISNAILGQPNGLTSPRFQRLRVFHSHWPQKFGICFKLPSFLKSGFTTHGFIDVFPALAHTSSFYRSQTRVQRQRLRPVHHHGTTARVLHSGKSWDEYANLSVVLLVTTTHTPPHRLTSVDPHPDPGSSNHGTCRRLGPGALTRSESCCT